MRRFDYVQISLKRQVIHNMYSKPVLKQLKPYAQGKQTDEIKTAYNLDRVVKLSSNENPYGYSEKVKEYFTTYIPDFNVYPDGYATQLRQTITDKLQINESQIVFGSGADEMIQTICRAFLSPEVNTVMAKPTFTQYKQGAVIEGRSEEHTSELQSRGHLVCRLLLEKKK